MTVEIARIPVLDDNYVWLMHDGVSGETVVIDPAVAEPVLDAAAERGWTITQIWNTHWHPDHVGGNAAIKAATGCTITGPAAEADKIGTLDRTVGEGDRVHIGGVEAVVMEVPAHTSGHIAYHMPGAGLVFTGDSLMAAGCGRLFEGTPAQMWASLSRLAALPGGTLVCSGHEYTASNIRFALSLEPGNGALILRAERVAAARKEGQPTVPVSLSEELETNPFLRAGRAGLKAAIGLSHATDEEAFAEIRGRKDRF